MTVSTPARSSRRIQAAALALARRPRRGGTHPADGSFTPYGSLAWFHASRRNPAAPSRFRNELGRPRRVLLPATGRSWVAWGARRGGGPAASTTGCPGAGDAPGAEGTGDGVDPGSALACPASANAPRLTAAPASASLAALAVGE